MAETRYWLFKSKVSIDTFDKLLAAENKTMLGKASATPRPATISGIKSRLGTESCFTTAAPQWPKRPEVVGTARVVSAAYPDHSAWDKSGDFYDPKTDPDNPKWLMVDIQADLKFVRPVTLREIKANPDPALRDMMLVQPGNRLSIQPVSKAAWGFDCSLGDGRLVRSGQGVRAGIPISPVAYP